MGCASSKVDDLPAVALCRERCAFLDEAIHQRYAFSMAHQAYLLSLKSVGASLRRFLDDALSHDSLPSPVLNLPPPGAHKKKLDPKPEPEQKPSSSSAAAIHHRLRDSHSSSSDSHLHFHSDSDSDDGDSRKSEALHHSHSPPLHHPYGGAFYPEEDHRGGGGFVLNYMKNQTTPPLVYEHRPVSPQIVHMDVGEPPSSSSSYSPYAVYSSNPNYPAYPNYPNYGGGGGFFGSSPPRPYGGSPPILGPTSIASTSKSPPPPPSPPRSSAWDFLNPFETYYPPYTPSRDSREVREEEGIPDLEDEEDEVVKEIHGDHKFADDSSSRKSYAKEDEDVKVNDPELLYRTMRPRSSMDNENDQQVEYEVHVVDKKVVDGAAMSGDEEKKARGGFKGDSDVIREIHLQFERASETGMELAKILEVGKLPYNRKQANFLVSSKMLHAVTPLSVSRPSTSESTNVQKVDPALLDIGEDVSLGARNISSTLQKLYLWEKKLYEEVKVEEKMRVEHDRKRRKLRRLDERGAEAHKVDTTRSLVRSLSTKIRIAIQVVDKISEKINKLRDEELWPQLNEFIQGLTRMWKTLLECHHNQHQAIGEAKQLDSIAPGKHFGDAHLEAMLQLEHELLNWTLSFSCWVSAQKGYVRALNNWLTKCLLYVPEETPDGIAPFSPGRMGAPPIFVICNQWSQSLERVSEKEVIDSMRDLASNILQMWDRDKLEMRQRTLANKDMERKFKDLEREDQKLQKEIHALDKQIILASGDESGLSVTGQFVHQSDTSKSRSIQLGLQRIFEAMERFCANSLKVYEDLLERIEEYMHARDHEEFS